MPKTTNNIKDSMIAFCYEEFLHLSIGNCSIKEGVIFLILVTTILPKGVDLFCVFILDNYLVLNTTVYSSSNDPRKHPSLK